MRSSGEALVDRIGVTRGQQVLDLDALVNAQNKSSNPEATTIPATFLRVTVDR